MWCAATRIASFEQPLFEEVARAIPRAEEADVGASGHMVMLERRDAVNRAISAFHGEQRPLLAQTDEPPPRMGAALPLLKERPWLPHYDNGVPYTIAIPTRPVHHLLNSAARRFPLNTALLFEGRRISYLQSEQEVNRFARPGFARPGKRPTASCCCCPTCRRW